MSQLISRVTLSRGILLLPKPLEIGCVTFSGLLKTVRSRVRVQAYLSRDTFPRHFVVTETPRNRVRDIFGSAQNAEVRTPSPSLSQVIPACPRLSQLRALDLSWAVARGLFSSGLNLGGVSRGCPGELPRLRNRAGRSSAAERTRPFGLRTGAFGAADPFGTDSPTIEMRQP